MTRTHITVTHDDLQRALHAVRCAGWTLVRNVTLRVDTRECCPLGALALVRTGQHGLLPMHINTAEIYVELLCIETPEWFSGFVTHIDGGVAASATPEFALGAAMAESLGLDLPESCAVIELAALEESAQAHTEGVRLENGWY